MPHLIVEHNDASGFSEVIAGFLFPLRSFQRIRRRCPEKMGTRNNFCTTVFNLSDIGEVVIRCKEQHRQTHVLWWFTVRYDVVWCIVLMPRRNSTAGIGLERIVMNDMAVFRDECLRRKRQWVQGRTIGDWLCCVQTFDGSSAYHLLNFRHLDRWGCFQVPTLNPVGVVHIDQGARHFAETGSLVG